MNRHAERIETKLIHAGELKPRVAGAVCLPIFQSAMFEYAGETSYDDLRYIRLNNTPNHLVLHRKLAALENAEAALVTASGMAAIATTLLTVLKAGDHLLAQGNLYGGTHDFITRDLGDYGILFDFIGPDPSSWKAQLKPTTRAVYVETMTNPLLQVIDLQAVAAFAREQGLVSLIDNTFASPIHFRPPEWGFDLSIHSCTKYLNGHSDIVGGAVIGSAAWVERDHPPPQSPGRVHGSPRLLSAAPGPEDPGPEGQVPEPKRPSNRRVSGIAPIRGPGELPGPARTTRPTRWRRGSSTASAAC